MTTPTKVQIVKVGPRDDLQNESQTIPLTTRLRLIEDLVQAGHTCIEAGNRVSAALGRSNSSAVARTHGVGQ